MIGNASCLRLVAALLGWKTINNMRFKRVHVFVLQRAAIPSIDRLFSSSSNQRGRQFISYRFFD
ncbi:MAG: hypothetical protein IJ189_09095 [Clostridia bacterium]|nr:hypothetical protein [Clostridia bacterium]